MSANVTLGIVGSLFTLTLLFELMRRHRLREKYAVLWALVAVMALLVTLFPGILFFAADVLGVSVPANLLFFVASMGLLGVSIHHSYEMGRLEDRTRTLAEEIGLLRMELDLLRGTDGDEAGQADAARPAPPDE
jgi:hypothetical protein